MSVERRIVEAAEAFPAIRLLVLFGSAAVGRATATSDVDVALVLDDPSADGRRTVEAALGRAAGKALDLVDLETAPPQLRFEIARDGKVLVERQPGAWVEFRARAMIDWWDWAPTARLIHRAAAERLRDEVRRGQS